MNRPDDFEERGVGVGTLQVETRSTRDGTVGRRGVCVGISRTGGCGRTVAKGCVVRT